MTLGSWANADIGTAAMTAASEIAVRQLRAKGNLNAIAKI
jgi:hypothetical protein